MIYILGKRDNTDEYTGPIVDVTSRSLEPWSKRLSPMYLGPVVLWNGYRAANVENAWQFSKVYSVHVGPDGEPSKYWWRWARQGWADHWAHRYPMGRGAVPEFSFWDNEKLGYVEARKRIYIPIYAEAARNSPYSSYKFLQSLYAEHGSLTLVDFDGYDHHLLGMTLDDVVNCEKRKMGHAFVLAMMLEGLV